MAGCWRARRVAVYLAASGLVAHAVATRGPGPDPLLVLVLGATYAAALLCPVVLDHRTARRSSTASGVVAAAGFLLPHGWPVLLCAAGAVAAGVQIRRYRTTPGGMVFGSSWMVIASAGGLAAQAAVLSDGPATTSRLALAGLAYFAGEAVAGPIPLLVAMPAARVRIFAVPGAPQAVGVATGTVAGILGSDPLALALLAVPHLGLILGGTRRAAAAIEHDRLRAVLELTEDARRQASPEAVDDLVAERCGRILGTRIRFGAPPGDGEVGAPFPSPAEPDRWLVAHRRSGPPTWQGQYRPDEARLLATVAAVASSAAENIRLVAHINHQMLHDPLTGLANRRLLEEDLRRRIAHAERHGRPFAVLVVDLDRFKAINDRVNHVNADAVLVEAARRLRDAARAEDTVARWGGEEFVVLAALDDPAELSAVADRVCRALRFTCSTGGHEVAVTASVGAAVAPADGCRASELLAAADGAVFAAKAAGRDRAVLASPAPAASR